MTPILAQFISESRDLLEMTGKGLLQLERSPDDKTVIDEVFRAVHTIKGASGLFDFFPMTHMVHAAEDLLDALRAQQISYTPEIGDLLLSSFDQVSIWIDALETDEVLPADADLPSRDLATRLRALLPDDTTTTSEQALETVAEKPTRDLSWLGNFCETKLVELYYRNLGIDEQAQPLQDDSSSPALIAIRYRPDSGAFFNGEDPLFVVCNAPGTIVRHIGVTTPLASPAELDPYYCCLDLQLISEAGQNELFQHFRYMPETVEITPVGALDCVIPQGLPIEALDPVHEDFLDNIEALLEKKDLESAERAIATLLELTNPDLWLASALRWFKLLVTTQPELPVLKLMLNAIAELQTPHWQTLTDSDTNAATTTASPSSAKETSTLHPEREVQPAEWSNFARLLKTQLKALEIPVDDELLYGRVLSISSTVTNALRYVGLVDMLDEVEECRESALEHKSTETLFNLVQDILLEVQHHLPDPENEAAPSSSTTLTPPPDTAAADTGGDANTRERLIPRVLKIDQARIDLLMDLIGELVVAKNALPYLATRAEQQFGVRELSREIKEQYGIVHRISQELQGAIMQVRMLPVSNIFQRFPRLVRDLSRKLDKRIGLVIEGEETEADKNIIESLGDPLIHILRNSIDHGIELPAVRLENGKPEEGTILIKAYPESDRVIIEISDDGKGIDPEVVKLKAFEKKLLPEEKLEIISDQEAIQLVLLPGFSTAAAISDLSGRGVGMDVVRQAVTSAGGELMLQSEKGKGTTVKLSLPLSMTVTQVMGVTVADQRFGVPIDIVSETVKISPERINVIKHQETFLLREQVIPLVRLERLLALSHETVKREELPILVIRIGNELVGVLVDAFHEGIEIILKPMEGFLGTLRGFSGTALLGNGSVLLVLDLRELILGMEGLAKDIPTTVEMD